MAIEEGGTAPTRAAGKKSTTAVRVTVNLTRKGADALDRAVDTVQDNQTDTINRALQVYAYLTGHIAEGWEVELTKDQGERKKVQFL